MDGEDKHSFVKTGKQEKGVTTWETINWSKIVRYKGNIQNNLRISETALKKLLKFNLTENDRRWIKNNR